MPIWVERVIPAPDLLEGGLELLGQAGWSRPEIAPPNIGCMPKIAMPIWMERAECINKSNLNMYLCQTKQLKIIKILRIMITRSIYIISTSKNYQRPAPDLLEGGLELLSEAGWSRPETGTPKIGCTPEIGGNTPKQEEIPQNRIHNRNRMERAGNTSA